MKKKILCMTLVVFVGMLSGCGTEDKEIQQGDNTTLENKVLENTVPENKETYDSSDGLPPVEPEMKQFYKEAEELFKDIVFLRLDCDDQQSKIEATDDEDVQVLYYKVTDERFPTMENLKEELWKYFTEQFTEELVSELMWNQPRFREYDGELYMIQASRSGNIQYAGHVFEAVESDGDTMKMPVKVYYALNATPYEYFYEYPEDLDAYEVKEYTQIMVKEGGQWKFSQFELFY